MAKLYFKYGAMGSSKSAQALTTKFNYEEKGMTVWLIKPGTDTRDGADIIKSRIGLQQKAQVIEPSKIQAVPITTADGSTVMIRAEDLGLRKDRLLADDVHVPLVVLSLPALRHALVAKALRNRRPLERERKLLLPLRDHARERGRHLRAQREVAV